MLPNMGGFDPKSMGRMMKQMGIDSKEIAATRVVIETEGKQILVDEPQVVQITMKGQVSFQISGKVSEQTALSAEDIKMVADSAGVDEKTAADALAKAKGDIAAAILSLQEEKK